MKQYDLKAKPIATGGPPATLTQVMSDQIDVGWSAPPVGLDLLDQGRIRLLATGNDTLFRDQTVRLLLSNVQTLQTRKAVIDRYLKAYRETIDWMYSDPAGSRPMRSLSASPRRPPGASATGSSPRRRSRPTPSKGSTSSSRMRWG